MKMRIISSVIMAVSVSFLLAASPVLASDALVAHWKFDETTSGATVVDSSGNGYGGTPIGGDGPEATTTVTAPTDFANAGSLYFDGVDDYVDLPDGFKDFTQGMTVTLWARPTAVKNWGRFIDFGNGSLSDNIIIARQNKTNNFYYEGYRDDQTIKVDAVTPMVLDEWHYYTVTITPQADGIHATTTIYVDGMKDVSETAYLPRNVTRTKNYIAKSNWAADDYYEGYIDEMRVYNRPLTPEQVAALSEGDEISDIDAPIATDDTATTTEDTAVTVDVLANDTDPNGDTLTIESITTPANGSATTSGNEIEYTPDANWSGTDSFSYTVSNGALMDTATVSMSISSVNDTPTAGFILDDTTDPTISFIDTSLDSDGTITNWSWDFGDNATSTEENPSHTYTVNGTYTVTLLVADDDNATSSATSTVSVSSITSDLDGSKNSVNVRSFGSSYTSSYIQHPSSLSASEMYAKIAMLIKKVENLQERLADISGGTHSTFTRDLTLGSTGEDVKALQHFLNTHGYPLAQSGVGSLGNETTYFGKLTQNAVIRYQTTKGIKPTVGYFGPLTRATILSAV